MNQNYCCFTIEDYHFIISTHIAMKVLPHASCTPIPLAPPEVAGLINYRGEVIMVLNLANLFKISTSIHRQQHIIVVQNDDLYTGILVDRVQDIHHIQNHQLHPLENDLPLAIRPYITKTCHLHDQQLLHLDINTVTQSR